MKVTNARGRVKVAALAAVSLLAMGPASAQETVSYTYDALGRVISVNHGSTGPNAGVSSSYTYDKADNRTAVTVTVPGPPAFAISNASATEGSPLVFTVTRSGSTAGTDTVQYATADGTATAGSDYNAVALTTLTFSPGQATKSVSITTIDDSLVESSETVNVNLSNASAVASIVDSLGVGTINDNDSATPCSGVSFAASNNPAANEGTTLSFTITKTGTTSDACSLSYQTADGTAHAGTNYTAKPLTSLSFASTATSKTVSVTTLDDHIVTGDLNMHLNLSAPSGAATITDSQSTGTIHNIDMASTCSGVSFSVGNASAHAGVTLSFTVTKTGTTSNTCSVSYATRDGTATTANGDYTAESGSLSFASTVTTQTVSVPTFDNGWSTTVNMYLDLSNPSGAATITTATGIGSILSNGTICPTNPSGTSTTSSSTTTGTTDTSTPRSPDTTGTTTTSPDSAVQPMQPIC
jgi:hypothetical protein